MNNDQQNQHQIDDIYVKQVLTEEATNLFFININLKAVIKDLTEENEELKKEINELREQMIKNFDKETGERNGQ